MTRPKAECQGLRHATRVRGSEEVVQVGGSPATASPDVSLDAVRYLDLAAATRALEQVEAELSRCELKDRLRPLVEAGLAIPGPVLERLGVAIENVYKGTRSYALKRCLLPIRKLLLKREILFFKFTILQLQREREILQRRQLLLQLRERLFRRCEFLRLVGGEEAPHGAERFSDALDGLAGGIEAGKGTDEVHSISPLGLVALPSVGETRSAVTPPGGRASAAASACLPRADAAASAPPSKLGRAASGRRPADLSRRP